MRSSDRFFMPTDSRPKVRCSMTNGIYVPDLQPETIARIRFIHRHLVSIYLTYCNVSLAVWLPIMEE